MRFTFRLCCGEVWKLDLNLHYRGWPSGRMVQLLGATECKPRRNTGPGCLSVTCVLVIRPIGHHHRPATKDRDGASKEEIRALKNKWDSQLRYRKLGRQGRVRCKGYTVFPLLLPNLKFTPETKIFNDKSLSYKYTFFLCHEGRKFCFCEVFRSSRSHSRHDLAASFNGMNKKSVRDHDPQWKF